MFATQGLTEGSDIVGEADVQAATKVFVSDTDGMSSRGRKQLWDALCKLCPTQSFPAQILHFLSSCFRDTSFYKMSKALLL